MKSHSSGGATNRLGMDKSDYTRGDFLRTLGLGVTWLAMGACRREPMSSIDQPNVIIIFADDLGYGDIEGFGVQPPPYRTPHLQRMAAAGARLTSCYVPTPFCAPSRATLLTGRYPFRNGMITNPSPDNGQSDFGLPASEITLAEALKAAGYATSCIGKWHLGHIDPFLPRRYGFDEYFGILYSNDMRPVQLVENEQVVEYPVIQANLTKRYTGRALDFIERNQKHPFFLYLPHAMPHKPLAASEDFYTPETADDLYADVIRELDWSVGQILDKLQELNLDRRTLVLFLSDNGPRYGGSTGGLRGMKSMTYEGGLRVPLIAWWPGKIPAGHVSNEVMGTIDIFPTVLKAASVEQPTDRIIDGEDVWSLFTSATVKSPHDAVLGMKGGTQIHTLRSGRWRLHIISPGDIPNRGGPGWVEPRSVDGVTIIAPYEQVRPSQYPGVLSGDSPKDMMLFDIENDPAEQHDVADQHPEVVKRLYAIYQKYADQTTEIKLPPRRFQGLRRIRGGDLEYKPLSVGGQR